MNNTLKLHNEFHIVLTDSKTGKIKQECTAYNLVTDRLYTYWTKLSSYYGAGDGRPNVIYVSTSSATPTPTMTSMPTPYWQRSVTLSSTYDGATFTSTKTGSVTYPETEANGNLTMVGAASYYSGYSSSYTNILTCALFTDAEGHPITINKTNTDRLTVEYKMYVTLNYDNSTNAFKLLARASVSQFLNTANVDDLSQAPSLLHNNLGTSYNCNGTFYLGLNTTPWNVNYQDNSLVSARTYSFNDNNRATTSRVLSTEYNKNITYQVKSLVFAGFGFIPLPNSSVFPPKEITLTAVGDGTTTDFNFGIPILKPSTVEVSIDDVVQSSNTYTWNGRDYTFAQAWESCDHKHVCGVARKCSWSDSISYDSYGLSPFVGNSIGGSYSHNADQDSLWYDYVYDFKTPYTVNTIESSVNRTQVTEIYYSSDKTNWTQVQGWTGQTTNHITITPVSARYWKLINGTARISGSHTADNLPVLIRFGVPTPQLKFNTAPAANTTITVKAYTEYPIKNSNWIIEPMTLDFNLQRAD